MRKMVCGLATMIVGLVFLQLAAPYSVQADQLYVYTYTGDAFTYSQGGFPSPASTYHITADFTYGVLTGGSLTPLNAQFTVSDGLRTLSSTDPNMYQLGTYLIIYGVTPVNGVNVPTAWDLNIQDSAANGGNVLATFNMPAPPYNISGGADISQFAYPVNQAIDFAEVQGTVANPQGVWTATPVPSPEPSTMLLFGAGIGGLALCRLVRTQFRKT